MTIYIGRVVSRHAQNIPRGQRYAHIRCENGHADLIILESGWVCNPNIETGVPLLNLPSVPVSRNGPSTFPQVGELVVFEPTDDPIVQRRWCRLRAFRNAEKRICAAHAKTKNHKAQMKLFNYLMDWLTTGREFPGPLMQTAFTGLSTDAVEMGTNPVLVERTVQYFLRPEVNTWNFYTQCAMSQTL